MNNEHTFVHFRESGTAAGTAVESNGLARGRDPHIAAALTELEQARIHAMSQQDADQTLRELGRIQSVAASLMCDVADMLVTSNTEADPAEMLRQGARLPTRESKRMARMAKTALGHAQGQGTVRHRGDHPRSRQRSGQRGGEGRSRDRRPRRRPAGGCRPDAACHVRPARP